MQTTATQTVPAYGYSAEAITLAHGLVAKWAETYSGQNFDRAQGYAMHLTDMQRHGMALSAAFKMLAHRVRNHR